MIKHTPGPWTIGEISECGQQVEIDTGPDKEFGIPSVWRGMATFYGCEDNPELGAKKALANATLAIAATDLLKVAQDFDEVLGEWGAHCECGQQDCRTTRLRAAIAKATGSAA